MAKQLINLGTLPNDGTGDNLRIGGDKINDNFNEIYSAIGNGTTAIGTIKVQDQTSTELTLSAKGDVFRIFGGQVLMPHYQVMIYKLPLMVQFYQLRKFLL